MISQARVPDVLLEMAGLLDMYGDKTWGNALRRLASDVLQDQLEGYRQIRGLYAGMGSLSDLVLYDSDGKVIRPENDRFDELRSELHQCVSNVPSAAH
ncbi:MAG: hypothetical protein ABI895_27885 [Deltaproteobacteria bacterium]